MAIVAIGTVVAIPQIQSAGWKRQFDPATRYLQTIADAIRLYQMDYAPDERLPWDITTRPFYQTATVDPNTGLVSCANSNNCIPYILQDKGYLKLAEYFRTGTSIRCYSAGYDPVGGSVYVMKIHPRATGDPPCDFSSLDYFWYSMDLSAGRAKDRKGMGTTIVRSREYHSNDF